MVYQSNWIPNANIVRHSGSPIPQEMVFLAAPPPEIGKIISAESTLGAVKKKESPFSQFSNAINGAIFGGFLGALVSAFIPKLAVIIIIIGAIIGIIVYIEKVPNRFSYVGEQGIALYTITNHSSPSSEMKIDILCFQQVKNLYTSQTRRYYNHSYTSTSYRYEFEKTVGNSYIINGSHHSENQLPPDDNHWHFASAAESAWTVYLLPIANDHLNRLGYVDFPFQSPEQLQSIRIGDGWMEFVMKNGTSQRATVADMKDIKLGAGHFQFNHKDAKWWSGKGKYSFDYSNIANAQMFLICLDRLTGIRWN